MLKKRAVLVFVFLLALTLRLIKVSMIPSGFTADEAAQSYTAYSILKTGSDEWGVKFPLNPRFFGDFKPPLLTYLMIPAVALFGLNEFSTRLPGALLGSLSVLVVYFLSKELIKGKRDQPNHEWIPLLSALFLAVNPWHISLSRAAFEMNLTTFFLPLAVWLFFLGLRSSLFMVLSSLAFGLNLFSYHSAKVVTPLIMVFLFFWKKTEIFLIFRSKDKKYLFTAAAVFLVCGAIIADGFFKGAGTRAADIGIFSGKYEQLADNKHFACSQGLPVPIARLFYNKLEYSLNEFVKNYLSYTSTYFLFAQGAGEATYGMMPGVGLLYLIEIPFMIFSFYLLMKERKTLVVFLWFWVIVSPIPASLARGVGYHASRVAVMMPAVQIFSAYGFISLINYLKKKYRIFAFAGGIIIYFFSTLFFLEKYFFLSPLQTSVKMNYGWKEAAGYIRDNSQADQIIISRSLSEPQAFVMYYLFPDPEKVQSQTSAWLRYKEEGKSFVDQIGTYTMGKYIFRNFSFPEDWAIENTLLVGTEADFIVPKKDIPLLKLSRIVKNENGKNIELPPVIKEEKDILYPFGGIAFKIIKL